MVVLPSFSPIDVVDSLPHGSLTGTHGMEVFPLFH